MIIEFETELGIIFQLDSEDLTYCRYFKNPATNKHPGHGTLVAMPPNPIKVGEPVTMMVKQWDGIVHVFSTSKVVAVKEYSLDSPEEGKPDLTVN